MTYRSTKECIEDLERHGMLLRIGHEVDGCLEAAEIHRQVFDAKGPAILFEKIKGSPFPAASNLFGTLERSQFIFRKTLKSTKDAIAIKANPEAAIKNFWRYWKAPITGLLSLPKKVSSGPVLECETKIDQLPLITSWPMDGGPFVTLPQVYTESCLRPGVMNSNIGMYRIQLMGNDYQKNKEVGVHYQIHRGMGIHHTEAMQKNVPLKVAIFIGGPPAHSFAAVMPLPENLPEVIFAGMLAGRRFRHIKWGGWTVAADADFCILGTIHGDSTKPEGPFGDHLGYYSLKHLFPVMTVEKVFHRKDAIWPFTVVGRPPQEDTAFGAMIHTMTKPMVPVSIPGVKAMHAVDAAGVHPLLFAVGTERYVPYQKTKPQELLTQANAILGFNQASLAKYLMIIDHADNPGLDINDESGFLQHVLERVDWTRDLHFQTKTTIDTLDYSGSAINEGSKVVIAARGTKIRDLATDIESNLDLPKGFSNPKIAIPGVLLLEGPAFKDYDQAADDMMPWTKNEKNIAVDTPLVVIVDDSDFASHSLKNFLWVTFTRSQPSHDIYGVGSRFTFKHWEAHGSLIIDARIKPHHAPPLVEDPNVVEKVSRYLETLNLTVFNEWDPIEKKTIQKTMKLNSKQNAE
ncbi:MAG: UbiD family decarboxylase [Proteobacteria bacterium]|nr:UbiD family decarboxylase [Pseudomonadota bacterium]